MKLDKEESKRVGIKVMRNTNEVQPKIEETKKSEKKQKKHDPEDFNGSEPISFRDEE